jgi:glycerol kinase
VLETIASGAAIAGGFAVIVWESFEELENINTGGVTTFTPKIGVAEIEQKFARW